MLKRKDLLGLYDVSAEEIDEILQNGMAMKSCYGRISKSCRICRGSR